MDSIVRDSASSITRSLTNALCCQWQNFAYWIMGAMQNEAPQLAYLIGFYKVRRPHFQAPSTLLISASLH